MQGGCGLVGACAVLTSVGYGWIDIKRREAVVRVVHMHVGPVGAIAAAVMRVLGAREALLMRAPALGAVC